MERLLAKLGRFITEKGSKSLKADTVKVYLPDFRRNITAIKIPSAAQEFTPRDWTEWLGINLQALKGDSLQNAAHLMEAFFIGAKYIQTSTRRETGRSDFQLPNVLISIKNDIVLGLMGYSYYIDSIMIASHHLKALSGMSQNKVIRQKYHGEPILACTPRQHMMLAGIEEADHAAYYRYVGSPITVYPRIRSAAQHDAEPIELRALQKQRRYAYSHQADFLPEQLKILDNRIQAAEAL